MPCSFVMTAESPEGAGQTGQGDGAAGRGSGARCRVGRRGTSWIELVDQHARGAVGDAGIDPDVGGPVALPVRATAAWTKVRQERVRGREEQRRSRAGDNPGRRRGAGAGALGGEGVPGLVVGGSTSLPDGPCARWRRWGAELWARSAVSARRVSSGLESLGQLVDRRGEGANSGPIPGRALRRPGVRPRVDGWGARRTTQERRAGGPRPN